MKAGRRCHWLRGRNDALDVRRESLEVADLDGEDAVGGGPEGSLEVQHVENRAAASTHGLAVAHGFLIVAQSEVEDSKATNDVSINDLSRLSGGQLNFEASAGEGCKGLGDGVGGCEAVGGVDEGVEGGVVVLFLLNHSRYEGRGVEIGVQNRSSRMALTA